MLSLVALTAAAHAGPAAGRVHWWLGSYNENYTSLNNKFISAHDGVDGVMYCCTALLALDTTAARYDPNTQVMVESPQPSQESSPSPLAIDGPRLMKSHA